MTRNCYLSGLTHYHLALSAPRAALWGCPTPPQTTPAHDSQQEDGAYTRKNQVQLSLTLILWNSGAEHARVLQIEPSPVRHQGIVLSTEHGANIGCMRPWGVEVCIITWEESGQHRNIQATSNAQEQGWARVKLGIQLASTNVFIDKVSIPTHVHPGKKKMQSGAQHCDQTVTNARNPVAFGDYGKTSPGNCKTCN